MAAPAQETRQESQEETRQMRRLAQAGRGSRAVLWTGVMLGTTLLVVAWRHGLHLRLPLHPALLAGFGGFLVEALAMIGLAMWAAHLVRRHHRTMISYTVRTTRQRTISAVRGARARGGWLARWLHAWADRRFTERGETWRDPLFLTRRPAATGGRPGQGASGQAEDHDGGGQPTHAFPDCAGCPHPYHWPAWCRDPDCRCGRDARPPRNAALAPADPAGAPAPVAARNGGNMAPPAPTAPVAPTPGAGPAPGAWNALVSDTHDFEAGDDGELLEWMAGQTAGMLRYGEAVADVHEHHVSAAVRLDPAAMAALHDVADAVADAAEAMARAREKFREVYEAPREFVGAGGVLPKDGDFLTGEDES